MDQTLTYRKVVSFELNFGKFKRMFDFPNETTYKDVWEKLIAHVGKGGEVVYTDNIESIEEEWEGYTLKEVVEASVTDMLDKSEDKPVVKRKLRKEVAKEAVEVKEERKPEKAKKQWTKELDGQYIEIQIRLQPNRVYKCVLKNDNEYELELKGEYQGSAGFQKAARKSSIKDIRIQKMKTPEHLVNTFGEFIYQPYKGKEEWHTIAKILTEDEVKNVDKAIKYQEDFEKERKERKKQ